MIAFVTFSHFFRAYFFQLRSTCYFFHLRHTCYIEEIIPHILYANGLIPPAQRYSCNKRGHKKEPWGSLPDTMGGTRVHEKYAFIQGTERMKKANG